MHSQCLICRTALHNVANSLMAKKMIVHCDVCGKYEMSEYLANKIYDYSVPNKYLYSAAIREKNEKGEDVWVENLDALLDSVKVPKTPFEKIDKILLNISDKVDSYDELRNFAPINDSKYRTKVR